MTGGFIYSKDGIVITNAQKLRDWLNSEANKKKLGLQHFTFNRQIDNSSLTAYRGNRPSFLATEEELWRYEGTEKRIKLRKKKEFIPDRIVEIEIPEESKLKLTQFNSMCKCKFPGSSTTF